MHFELIRRVDRYIGTPLCSLLTLWRRVGDLFGGHQRAERPTERLLFIKLIEQGANVLAWGAIRRAAEKYGRENLYFCVFSENRPIVDILDMVPPENIFEIRSDRLSRFVLDCLKLFVRCRREGIDTTIDLEGFSRAPAILGFLTGARRRVGLHRFTSESPYRGDLMTHRMQYNPHLHTAEQYAALIEALEAPPGQTPLLKAPVADLEIPFPRFSASGEERSRVSRLLEEEAGGAIAGPLVLLNPNASDLLPLRRWAPDRFVELGKRILAEYPRVTVAITGAPSERPAASEVAAAIGSPPRVLNLAGRTTLRELLVLYTLADVLVTNDSGPGHFASMTDIRSIVLFGPETPLLWGPRGGRPHVIASDLACSPCVNVFNHCFSPCTDNLCMQRIGVDQVYSAVVSCLEEAAEDQKAKVASERVPVS